MEEVIVDALTNNVCQLQSESVYSGNVDGLRLTKAAAAQDTTKGPGLSKNNAILMSSR